jgi:hypothetical protein
MRASFELRLRRKILNKSKKGLTSEMDVDNLEKFAKTSLVAEVILDRPKYGRKEIERAI